MSGQVSNVVFDGSFRDPEGQVGEIDGTIFRFLSPTALDRFREVSTSGLLDTLVSRGLIVPTRLATQAELGLAHDGYADGILVHEKIPCFSYPWEWGVESRLAAARVSLELLRTLLEHGYLLKDGTALNLTFHKGRMTWSDVLSIDTYRSGQVWIGYQQFCRTQLFPILADVLLGVDPNPRLRGDPDGYSAREIRAMLGFTRSIAPGNFQHVFVQSLLERSAADPKAEGAATTTLAGMPKSALLKLVTGLEKCVDRLAGNLSSRTTQWTDYAGDNSYSAEEYEAKKAFVRDGVSRVAPRRAVDLGCNTGDFSLLCADVAETVVSVDVDPAVIDAFRKRLLADGIETVYPMVGDLANPSPAQGFELSEHQDLPARCRSDFFLALALIHHLAIGKNVPLPRFIRILADLAPAGIVEWVDPADDMVRYMLKNRPDMFGDYTKEAFLGHLDPVFSIEASLETHGGKRTLFLVRRRDTA